jgi:hypothetical protein
LISLFCFRLSREKKARREEIFRQQKEREREEKWCDELVVPSFFSFSFFAVMFCFSSTCEQTEAKREREGEKWRRVTKRFGCFFSLVCFSRADRWKVFQTFFSRAHALLKAFPGLLLRRRRSTRFSALLSGGACKIPSNRRRNKRRKGKKKKRASKRALSVEVEVGEKKIRFFLFVLSFPFAILSLSLFSSFV